jgi:hypothetical protein
LVWGFELTALCSSAKLGYGFGCEVFAPRDIYRIGNPAPFAPPPEGGRSNPQRLYKLGHCNQARTRVFNIMHLHGKLDAHAITTVVKVLIHQKGFFVKNLRF